MKNILNIKKIALTLVAVVGIHTNLMAEIDWDGPTHRNLVYKNASGQNLRLDLFLPKNNNNAPLVIYTHGGGWSSGTKTTFGSFSVVAERLLNAGVAFASVEYRLTNNEDVIIRDCIIDSKDACRFLTKNRSRYGLNHKKVAYFGDSAGGHIAMMCSLTALRHSYYLGDAGLIPYSDAAIRGCVAWYGASSFRAANAGFWTSGGRNLNQFENRLFGDIIVPFRENGVVNAVSPILQMKSVSPRLLLIHGNRDTVIPVKHTLGMRNRANAVNNDKFSFVVVDNARHNFVADNPNFPISPTRGEIIDKTVDALLSYIQ